MLPVDPAMRRRVVISSTLGNALEWFDFTVFGLFAGVIGKLFFPAQDPANSLLYIFATFGIAFAARPVGGIVFGIYADKWGRKSALVVMILAMAIGTGLIGILPTYATIGVAAPVIILDRAPHPGFFRRWRIRQCVGHADRVRAARPPRLLWLVAGGQPGAGHRAGCDPRDPA